MGPYCMFYKHFTVYTSQVLVFCPQKKRCFWIIDEPLLP